jgi:hypothetical protein
MDSGVIISGMFFFRRGVPSAGVEFAAGTFASACSDTEIEEEGVSRRTECFFDLALAPGLRFGMLFGSRSARLLRFLNALKQARRWP